VTDNTASPALAISAGTFIEGASGALSTAATTKFADGDVFTINGKTVTIKAAATRRPPT